MYLLFIIILACITYGGLTYFFPLFFGVRRAWRRAISFRSLLVILLLGASVHLATLASPFDVLDNRILHIFGGGFLALLLCYLAERDSKLSITVFQFVFLSFCVAMTLGVGNEILEFVLQNYFDITAARSINDTWLDLISNALGAIIACALFAPFLHKRHLH